MAIVKWRSRGPHWPGFFDDDNWRKLVEWPDFTDSTSGMDIYETDDSIVVEAQVPGVKEENVDVKVDGNVLTITAEEQEVEEEKQKKKTIFKASRQTCFSYSTSLPRMVDSSKAQAEVENGVVKVIFPKEKEDKAKKIEVKKRG